MLSPEPQEILGLDEVHSEQVITSLIEKAVPIAISTVSALLILIIGLFLAGWIKRVISRVLERSDRIDATLARFFASLLYYGLIAIVFVTVLGQFGIETTSFAALIGAAGIAIGLALQGTLSHLASGAMLVMFRPFKLGDYVIAAGHEGTIRDITLFTTTLATIDNKSIIIPNGKVWDDSITNFSANATRRLDLIFGISYDDDINATIATVLQVIADQPLCLSDPEPIVAVDALGDFSVDLTVRVWVETGNYVDTKWALNKEVKEAFDKKGITIPFPTRTEHHLIKNAN